MTDLARTGTVFGVGLGPGNPDLMSVKADRLIRSARHVAYFRKVGKAGLARSIVSGMLPPDTVEFPMEYPVTTEIALSDPAYNASLAPFYAECVAHLTALVRSGEDVVVLCEGDPFFYGSFMHLHARLEGLVPVEVLPATTGMSGAWTATGQPITWGDDVLTVLMATLPEPELARRMADTDALVVMKIGRNMDRVRRALATAGKLETAFVVEYATMPNQRVTRLVDMAEGVTPYFTIVLLHGQGRRP